MGNNGFPAGKYMTTVKVGPKGQIVIPGIALPPKAQAGQIFAAITAAMPKRKDDKA